MAPQSCFDSVHCTPEDKLEDLAKKWELLAGSDDILACTKQSCFGVFAILRVEGIKYTVTVVEQH